MLARLKPGASIQTHLLVAACIWTGVGGMLVWRGVGFLQDAQKVWITIPAIIIGTLKSIVILDKSARKNLARILGRFDGACLGGVYSLRMWMMIVAMMILGRLLRSSGINPWIIGITYVAVGWGLFFSSRILWIGRLQDHPTK